MPFDRELIEARLALDLIASSDIPRLAWDALEADLDGPAVRRLAALQSPTYFEVVEVLPKVMEELGLSKIQPCEAAVRLSKDLISEILRDDKDPLKFTRTFEGLWIKTNYCKALLPLGTLNDDVSVARSMGQSDTVIREWIMQTLITFHRAKDKTLRVKGMLALVPDVR